jgi:predicted nuclease with TOPRIM domain
LKALREENVELKEEVDRLEGAYEDIMKEFGKMQSLHTEITQMADEALHIPPVKQKAEIYIQAVTTQLFNERANLC